MSPFVAVEALSGSSPCHVPTPACLGPGPSFSSGAPAPLRANKQGEPFLGGASLPPPRRDTPSCSVPVTYRRSSSEFPALASRPWGQISFGLGADPRSSQNNSLCCSAS
ncbi:hypothetical protein KIL84_021675 [Mauremys mutica]|uniref:Uncharacterized protein n=1 Tax=Mauremys mutica TaxID=74926 RepID=A0A9D4B040_9SAUR|nr:hypothetical protein KIL84_021675 [Mauremys mutica]